VEDGGRRTEEEEEEDGSIHIKSRAIAHLLIIIYEDVTLLNASFLLGMQHKSILQFCMHNRNSCFSYILQPPPQLPYSQDDWNCLFPQHFISQPEPPCKINKPIQRTRSLVFSSLLIPSHRIVLSQFSLSIKACFINHELYHLWQGTDCDETFS